MYDYCTELNQAGNTSLEKSETKRMISAMNKKRGRGRPSQGRSEHLEVKLTPKEKAQYEKAAQGRGLSLSDWVRLNLTACSSPPPDKNQDFATKLFGT